MYLCGQKSKQDLYNVGKAEKEVFFASLKRYEIRRLKLVFARWHNYCTSVQGGNDIQRDLEQETHKAVKSMFARHILIDDVVEVFLIAVTSDETVAHATSCRKSASVSKVVSPRRIEERKYNNFVKDKSRIFSPTANSLLREISKHLEPRKKSPHKAWM